MASGQRVIVASFAIIVSASVEDNSTSNNTVGSIERDQAVLEVEENEALPVGLHVAEVTNVPLLVSGCTMVLAVGVEVGSSSGAASAQVTRLVNVEASLSVGVKSGKISSDLDWPEQIVLLKIHISTSSRVSSALEHNNGLLMNRRQEGCIPEGCIRRNNKCGEDKSEKCGMQHVVNLCGGGEIREM